MNITEATTLAELKEVLAQINTQMEELERTEPKDEHS